MPSRPCHFDGSYQCLQCGEVFALSSYFGQLTIGQVDEQTGQNRLSGSMISLHSGSTTVGSTAQSGESIKHTTAGCSPATNPGDIEMKDRSASPDREPPLAAAMYTVTRLIRPTKKRCGDNIESLHTSQKSRMSAAYYRRKAQQLAALKLKVKHNACLRSLKRRGLSPAIYVDRLPNPWASHQDVKDASNASSEEGLTAWIQGKHQVPMLQTQYAPKAVVMSPVLVPALLEFSFCVPNNAIRAGTITGRSPSTKPAATFQRHDKGKAKARSKGTRSLLGSIKQKVGGRHNMPDDAEMDLGLIGVAPVGALGSCQKCGRDDGTYLIIGTCRRCYGSM